MPRTSKWWGVNAEVFLFRFAWFRSSHIPRQHRRNRLLSHLPLKSQAKRAAENRELFSRSNYALFFAAAEPVESIGRARVPCTSNAAWVELVPSKLSSVFCVFSSLLSASL